MEEKKLGTNKLPFGFKEQKVVELTQANVDYMFLNPRHRKQSATHINKIRNNINQGIHFDLPISVLETERKSHIIIDGNQRYMAIKKALETDKKVTRIPVQVNIYTRDTDAVRLYARLNAGRPEKFEDFMNFVQDHIDIFKRIKKDFPHPVSIYAGQTTIHLKTLLAAYLGIWKSGVDSFKFLKEVDAFEHLQTINNLPADTYDKLYAFTAMMRKNFGLKEKDVPFYRRGVFIALMRIWFDNIDRFGAQHVSERIGTLKSCPKLWQIVGGGRADVLMAYSTATEYMNKGRVKADKLILVTRCGDRPKEYPTDSIEVK